jgi:cytochrome c oxidase assembly protein subunit 15
MTWQTFLATFCPTNSSLLLLTQSNSLSITEWKPVTGSLPPMSQEAWDLEFAKYRSSPEFKLLNSRMTLSEFKKIYFMEWTHRLWGRIIGMTFLIPTIYFIARRKVAGHMALKMVGICGLIGTQGVIGWWMVKSGLKDDLFAPGSHPRVSQYRLAAHLGTAFLVYIAMLWNGLSILRENKLLSDPAKASALTKALNAPPLRKFKVLTTALFALVFTTAMSGALVAGLDAGLIYNEFPWMGLGLTPPKAELFDAFYSHTQDRSDLWWRNMLENPSLVQLDHRILATTTFSAIVALWAWPRLSSNLKQAMLKNVAIKDVGKRLNGVLHLAILQVTLGISALIYMVPLWLGAAHQAGALALLTGMVVLGSKLRVSPRTLKLLAKQRARGAQAFGSSPAVLKRGVGKAAGGLEQKVV